VTQIPIYDFRGVSKVLYDSKTILLFSVVRYVPVVLYCLRDHLHVLFTFVSSPSYVAPYRLTPNTYINISSNNLSTASQPQLHLIFRTVFPGRHYLIHFKNEDTEFQSSSMNKWQVLDLYLLTLSPVFFSKMLGKEDRRAHFSVVLYKKNKNIN
jgi:hypothetical protein